jgi:putative ABC transport system ATP-binding protein
MDAALTVTELTNKNQKINFLNMKQNQANQSTNSIIQATDLSKVVITNERELEILKKVDLSINSGESIAIMGASGSGKTTLISLLAGLDEPSSGNILIGNQDLLKLDEDGRAELRNQLIGFVFQSFQLLPSLTALENVMLPLELVGNEDAREAATALLERVGLSHRLAHVPKQLSGGEQQRVALARAFVTQPAILFADEPTGNLDSKTGKQIIELLFELNREHQTTLVLVTHDQALATLCQRSVHLEEGRII